MKQLTFLMILGIAVGATGATRWKDAAAPGATSIITSLTDGSRLRVDALAPNLFRIRRSRDGVWTESGLNRYGILRRDWSEAKPEWRVEGGFVTPAAAITIDAAAGTVQLTSVVSRAALVIGTRLTAKGCEVTFPLQKDERIYGLGDASRENIQRRPGR